MDRRLTADTSYLLVTQYTASEANVIRNQREHCPALARVDFLDTIPLARHLIPGLVNYKLDTLLVHFSVPQPADCHRAYADVDVTAQVFLRLVTLEDESGQLSDLAALVKIAGRTAKCNLPVTKGGRPTTQTARRSALDDFGAR